MQAEHGSESGNSMAVDNRRLANLLWPPVVDLPRALEVEAAQVVAHAAQEEPALPSPLLLKHAFRHAGVPHNSIALQLHDTARPKHLQLPVLPSTDSPG